MKRGLLVYEDEDIPQNSRFILYARDAAQELRLSLELCRAKELEASLSGIAFAILRTRAPKMHNIAEAAGVRCFNSARLNETANDKMLCYDLLHDHVPMPPSFDALLSDSPPFLPCVVKPAHGHGGINVSLVYDKPSYLQALAKCAPDRPLVQRFVDPSLDKRIYVIGGKPVCAMLRSSNADFRSNYKLGGSAKLSEISEEELEIVKTVQKLIPIDYAGVDIVYDKGRPMLGEIEDPVGARMVYENTDINIIAEFIKYVYSLL